MIRTRIFAQVGALAIAVVWAYPGTLAFGAEPQAESQSAYFDAKAKYEEDYEARVCKDDKGRVFTCPLPYVNSVPVPATPADCDAAIFRSSFQAAVSGVAFLDGFQAIGKRFKNTEKGNYTCAEMRSDPVKSRCCTEGYFLGLQALSKKLDEFTDQQSAKAARADGKWVEPTEDEQHQTRCSFARANGLWDADQVCRYYDRAKNKHDPKACPRTDLLFMDQRACYMLGFLGRVRSCGCPMGTYADQFFKSHNIEIWAGSAGKPSGESFSSGEMSVPEAAGAR